MSGRNYIIRIMWRSAGPWLRQVPKESPHRTELAMVAARAGDHVFVVGAGDPALAAELARVTGLNGQLTVIDETNGAAARVEHAARQAGALVTFHGAPPTALPVDRNSADIVLIVRRLGTMNEGDRLQTAVEAWRVVRPGGRLIAIEGGGTSGMFRIFRAPSLDAEAIRAALAAGGWRASRLLAEVRGAIYVEATKPRT
jgi:hypothetical protein